MNARILLVDDEPDLLELLEINLRTEGYSTEKAQTADQAIQALDRQIPDVILMDVMLPETSGIALTAKLKNDPLTARIPIIMLTAKDTDTDMIVGLKVGADDYITKPFSTQVLVARIEAVLRRVAANADNTGPVITAGPLRLVTGARQVRLDGANVDLTSGEYDILMALVKASPNILSREQLKEALGPDAVGQKIRIVDVHIAAIRKKLGKDRSIIKTVHGRGYRINT